MLIIRTNAKAGNVNNRIKLKYGSNYEMTITSEAGSGTEVRLKIPAKKVHDV